MPLVLEAKDAAEVMRGPECVDKVWDEQMDGAWAPGKAPVSLLTTFLKCVQERDSVEAERAAREILEKEPNNRLVRDILDAMKQHEAMEAAAEVEGESDEDGEEEDSEEEGDCEEDCSSEEDYDEPDSNEADPDAKNNGGA